MPMSGTKLSIASAISMTLQRYGIAGFWRGVLPACIRTIPVSGVAMVGYEWIRKYA
jgi:hypothetical protein